MRFTREQRMAIVREYETSSLTGAELAVKYGFKNPCLIATWRKRLQKPPVLSCPEKSRHTTKKLHVSFVSIVSFFLVNLGLYNCC